MIPQGVTLVLGLIKLVLKKQKEKIMAKKVGWFEWLKQSSTIRGIIVLAGLVGWGVSPETVEIFVGAGAAIAYAIYNLVRNDSVNKAKDALFGDKGFARVLPIVLAFVLMLLAGVVLLALTLALPRYFFPFVWIAPYLITAALNGFLGHRTLERDAARGDRSPHVALALGALVCGFFWELWNYWAFPRWTYSVPFVDFAHVFEMPLLGYGGYLPFGLELFALYHLVSGLLGGRMDDYLRL